MAKTLRINDNSLSDHMHLEDGKLNRKKKLKERLSSSFPYQHLDIFPFQRTVVKDIYQEVNFSLSFYSKKPTELGLCLLLDFNSFLACL